MFLTKQLNIFSQLPETDQKYVAVMVWFHGGSYSQGNTKIDMYGPDFLLTENIVLVTVNYRIGILGKLFYSFIYSIYIHFYYTSDFSTF